VLGLTEASLRRALSPAENVAVRSVTGGPAPNEVLRSTKASRERLAGHETWWRDQLENSKLHAAVWTLRQRV